MKRVIGVVGLLAVLAIGCGGGVDSGSNEVHETKSAAMFTCVSGSVTNCFLWAPSIPPGGRACDGTLRQGEFETHTGPNLDGYCAVWPAWYEDDDARDYGWYHPADPNTPTIPAYYVQSVKTGSSTILYLCQTQWEGGICITVGPDGSRVNNLDSWHPQSFGGTVVPRPTLPPGATWCSSANFVNGEVRIYTGINMGGYCAALAPNTHNPNLQALGWDVAWPPSHISSIYTGPHAQVELWTELNLAGSGYIYGQSYLVRDVRAIATKSLQTWTF